MNSGKVMRAFVPPAIGTGALLMLAITSLCLTGADGKDPADGRAREDTVSDIDGNTYRTVAIGAQVWMAENLKVTRYRDGTPIPRVQEDDRWSVLETGAYCLSSDNPSAYMEDFGALYNFYAVDDERGLCPECWHVPTADEWRTLIEYLGGSAVAGAVMREAGSKPWKTAPPGANNSSGFSALPAGGRGRFGSVGEVGQYATWWSSTPHDAFFAWHWGLHPDRNSIRFNPGHKASGFSVRCIKDR